MKSVLQSFIFGTMIVLIQFSIVIPLSIKLPFMIDLPMMFVIYIGIYRSTMQGQLTGFFVGLLQDSLGVFFLGMGMLSYSLTGFISGYIHNHVYTQHYGTLFFICIISYGVKELTPIMLLWLTSISYNESYIITEFTWLGFVLNTLFNAALMPLIFYLFRKFIAFLKKTIKPVYLSY